MMQNGSSPGMAWAAARDVIIAAGRWLDTKGWAPATAGNYSARLDDGAVAVTVSGRHKGRLGPEDVMRVDLDGTPLEPKRPSAETALHCQIYSRMPPVGAVLHSHSPPAVGLSRAFPNAPFYRFAGHEMLKVLPGFRSHEDVFELPLVDNAKDLDAVCTAVDPWLDRPRTSAYLIRGHGVYAWGRDMDEAARVIEAVEFLIAAELAERQFRQGLA